MVRAMKYAMCRAYGSLGYTFSIRSKVFIAPTVSCAQLYKTCFIKFVLPQLLTGLLLQDAFAPSWSVSFLQPLM